MQFNILWTGREYYSLEHCVADVTATGTQINSVIIGTYKEKIYRVDYHIETNAQWETVLAEINCYHNNRRHSIRLESDGNGNWTINHQKADRFQGCMDVDIPLTPFTNTLPIRRLGLEQNQSQEIRVIYCDLLNEDIFPVNQKYTCLSPNEYHYENVPNDFEARIKVDEDGFVVDYPALFVRTAAQTQYI